MGRARRALGRGRISTATISKRGALSARVNKLKPSQKLHGAAPASASAAPWSGALSPRKGQNLGARPKTRPKAQLLLDGQGARELAQGFLVTLVGDAGEVPRQL